MCKVRIVGVGSPFVGDNIGWQAADYLRDELERRHPGLVHQCDLLDRPGAVLLEYLKPGEDLVFLLDAVAADSSIHLVRTYSLEELVSLGGVSSHGFGVADTLLLGKSLGSLHREIFIIGIACDATDWHEALMTEVDAILATKPCVPEV